MKEIRIVIDADIRKAIDIALQIGDFLEEKGIEAYYIDVSISKYNEDEVKRNAICK